MKRTFLQSISPFLIFGLAVTILLSWGWLVGSNPTTFLVNLMPVIFFVVFELIIEAASQANPIQVQSPVLKLIGRYSNIHDKYVVMIALATWLMVMCIFLSVIDSGFWAFVTGGLAFLGVSLAFGTIELRSDMLKTIWPWFKEK